MEKEVLFATEATLRRLKACRNFGEEVTIWL